MSVTAKKTGHKDEGTFTNKMGGSIAWNRGPIINSNLNKLNNLVKISNQSSVVKYNKTYNHILKGDSGPTNHYVVLVTIDILKNIYPNIAIVIMLPDNSQINSIHKGNF